MKRKWPAASLSSGGGAVREDAGSSVSSKMKRKWPAASLSSDTTTASSTSTASPSGRGAVREEAGSAASFETVDAPALSSPHKPFEPEHAKTNGGGLLDRQFYRKYLEDNGAACAELARMCTKEHHRSLRRYNDDRGSGWIAPHPTSGKSAWFNDKAWVSEALAFRMALLQRHVWEKSATGEAQTTAAAAGDVLPGVD